MHRLPRDVVHLIDALLRERTVARIWERDVSVWPAASAGADPAAIANRLGWLDAAHVVAPDLPRLVELGMAVGSQGVRAVCLFAAAPIGLAANAVRTLNKPPGAPELVAVSRTDEPGVRAAIDTVDPREAIFVIAGARGDTRIVASVEEVLWTRATAVLAGDTRRHFVAVAAPGSAMEEVARTREYRELFLEPADVGVRFSALSFAGLAPAAVLGASVTDLRAAGAAMAEGCRQENQENAGVVLGAFIAAALKAGRSRLTLAFPARLAPLGVWAGDLVAGSTSAHAGGVRPSVETAIGPADAYGPDRAFVSMTTEVDEADTAALDALERAGHPVLRLSMRTDGLGAEFFRWEFAAAIAGAALQTNPFSETDV
jgi:hypothetical protein